MCQRHNSWGEIGEIRERACCCVCVEFADADNVATLVVVDGPRVISGILRYNIGVNH